jgi:hypothetical protein
VGHDQNFKNLIKGADAETLLVWSERVLTAERLEEVVD